MSRSAMARNAAASTAIVAMAPGHRPEAFAGKSAGEAWPARNRPSRPAAAAKSEVIWIPTRATIFEVGTTAAAYVSFFDPAGPAIMSRNAAALKGASLLWVIGTDDAGARAVARGGKIITVPGGHSETPKVSAGEVVAWLQSL